MANERITLIIGGMPVKKFRGWCAICGKSFICNSNTTKYCSNECQAAGIGGDVDSYCEMCGKPFRKKAKAQRFCSTMCNSKARYIELKAEGREKREKIALLEKYMKPEETKKDAYREKETESVRIELKPTPVPDGCIFVRVSSNSGYWAKAKASM